MCHTAEEMGKPKESRDFLQGQGEFQCCFAQRRNLKWEQVNEFRNSL